MKATLTRDYFSDPNWIYEPKFDGIRCLAFKQGDEARLLTRNRLALNEAYPTVARAVVEQEPDFILDGEIAAVTKDGRTSFSLLQQARKQKVPVMYFVFDIVFCDGRELRGLPLLERKGVLKREVRWRRPLRRVEYVHERGEAYFREACERGLEGVIAKRAESTYVEGRSTHWLKFKCSNEQEFVIGGFTDPHGSRVGFGALLIGYYDDGELRFSGKVGTGFDTEMLLDLRGKLDRLEIDDPPFSDVKGIKKKGTHWVKPELVAQIAFSEWTSDLRLRHPRFVGLRADKPAREVVREKPS